MFGAFWRNPVKPTARQFCSRTKMFLARKHSNHNCSGSNQFASPAGMDWWDILIQQQLLIQGLLLRIRGYIMIDWQPYFRTRWSLFWVAGRSDLGAHGGGVNRAGARLVRTRSQISSEGGPAWPTVYSIEYWTSSRNTQSVLHMTIATPLPYGNRLLNVAIQSPTSNVQCIFPFNV